MNVNKYSDEILVLNFEILGFSSNFILYILFVIYKIVRIIFNILVFDFNKIYIVLASCDSGKNFTKISVQLSWRNSIFKIYCDKNNLKKVRFTRKYMHIKGKE